MVLAALDVTDWSGYGGHHCLGTIHHPSGEHDLIRKLSRKEAKIISGLEESVFWPEETNRYESREDLERAALQWCKENLGDVWLLLEYDTHNPNHVIGAKGFTKSHLNRIEKFQKQWWAKTSFERSKTWKRAYEIWNKLLKPT